MSKNINLLSKDRVQNLSQQKYLPLVKKISIFSLVVTGGTSLVFFILTLSPVLSNVKQQENTLIQNLNFSKNKIAKYLFVKDRISAAEVILNTRFPLDSVIDVIKQQIPSDGNIDQIAIQGKELSLKVSSVNLDSLNTVITNIVSLTNQKKIFGKILLQSISSDNITQVYTLNLQADLL